MSQLTQQMAKIEGIGYIPETKVKIPNRAEYSSLELMLYHQGRNERMSTSKEWSQILLQAEKNFPDLAKDMIYGDVEVQASIIAWPNKKGDYANNIRPRIDKGRSPVLLQGFTVKGTNDRYELELARNPIVLNDFLEDSGTLEEPVDELGLPKGIYVWSNSDFKYEQGLRAVVRGSWGWRHVGGRFGTDADWGPSARDSGLASRPIFEKVDQIDSQELKELVTIEREKLAELERKAIAYDTLQETYEKLRLQ